MRCTCLVVVGAFALAPRLARADDPPCAAEAAAVKKLKQRDPSLRKPTDPGAVKHLDAAARAFGVGEYDTAIDEYTAAGLIDDAPLVLYDLGQTYRAAKDYEKAIRQYKLFVERGAPGAELRALVECQIDTMTKELDHAAATAPPSGPAPEAQPAASTAPATIDAEAPARRSRWTTTREVGAGVGAVGVLAVAAGVVFGVQSQGFKDDAAQVCPSSPCADPERANALSARATDRAKLANVSFGVGTGLAVTAVVLWLVGAPSHHTSAEVAVVPHASGDFTGLTVSGRF